MLRPFLAEELQDCSRQVNGLCERLPPCSRILVSRVPDKEGDVCYLIEDRHVVLPDKAVFSE